MIEFVSRPGSVTRAWPIKLASVFAAFFVAVLLGCSQPAAPPTPTPSLVPKAETPKEAKPEAKDSAKVKEVAKGAGKLTRIKVAYAAITGGMAPLWVTKDKGLFEKYGLDVDMQYVASGTTIAQAMAAGDVALAQTGSAAVINAFLGGADQIIIAATDQVLPFSMYSLPAIQRMEDLKGKAVGVARFGSSTDFAARQTLKKAGLEPEKDVAIIQTGGTPETMAALQAGGIQAGVFGPPTTLKAKKAGFRELVNIADLGIPYTSNCIAVTKRYLSNNQEVARSFLMALLEGIAVSKKDKAFAMKAIGKYSDTNDQEVLDETYEFYVNKLLPKVPYVPLAAVQTVLDDVASQNPKAKDVKPESIMDNSLLKELDESGFIKKLYGE